MVNLNGEQIGSNDLNIINQASNNQFSDPEMNTENSSQRRNTRSLEMPKQQRNCPCSGRDFINRIKYSPAKTLPPEELAIFKQKILKVVRQNLVLSIPLLWYEIGTLLFSVQNRPDITIYFSAFCFLHLITLLLSYIKWPKVMIKIAVLIWYILGLSIIWVLSEIPDNLLLRQRMILVMTLL